MTKRTTKAKKMTDTERLDWLQSLCPKKNKTAYEFNLSWTSYAAHYGGHVAVRGKSSTCYRSSIRAAIDAAIKADRASRKSKGGK